MLDDVSKRPVREPTRADSRLRGVMPFATRWSFPAAALLWTATAAAHAQDFPTRPIRVLVPYTAGGPSDVGTRLMSDPLARHLGQPLVIENKGGAAGLVGTEHSWPRRRTAKRCWSAPTSFRRELQRH